MSEKTLGEKATAKKEQLVDTAIEFFSKNGIAETKIEDITNALGIGKGTFYLYFKSKKDLLLHCVSRLSTIIVPKEVWEDIRRETDYGARSRKRLIAFLKAYPTFFGILNLANESLQSARDPSLTKEAYDTYRLLAGPLIKDFRWATNAGLARKLDEDIFAFLLLGIGESLGNLRKIDPRFTPEELADAAWDFVLHGISLPGGPGRVTHVWEILDEEGHTVRLRNLRFNEETHLSGRIGKGELKIRPENVRSFVFSNKNDSCSVSVVTTSDDSVVITIEGNVVVSGDTDLGRYAIPLRQVTRITLADGSKT